MVRHLTKIVTAFLAVAAMVSAVPSASAQGTIYREYWLGIVGGNVTDLLNHANYPNNPNFAQAISVSVFETPTDWSDYYGQRVRAFVTPPETGFYTFWCVSDDEGQLFLSTDDNPLNAQLIAWTTTWANPRDWNDADVTPSGPIYLVAGQQYYIEVLHVEGSGGDNLAVGWQLPSGAYERPIPGSRLSVGPRALSSVDRTLPASYTPGTTFSVTLLATSWVTTGAVTVIENFSGAGLTITNTVASVGTVSIVGDEIRWDVADNGGVDQTLTYEVTVDAGVCGLVILPDGRWSSGMFGGPVGGDRRLQPIDDGWNNAPIGWTDAVDLGLVGAPGYTNWLSCSDVYLMGGAGNDVWLSADECQFLYTWVTGDFTIAGQFLLTNAVEPNTKFGLMMRESLATNAAIITTEISERDEGPGTFDNQCVSVQLREQAGVNASRITTPRIWNWDDAYLVLTRKLEPGDARVAVLLDPMDPVFDLDGLRKVMFDFFSDEITTPLTRNLGGQVAVGLYIVGHNEPLVGEGMAWNVTLTSTTSVLDSNAAVSRDLSNGPAGSYTPGGPGRPAWLLIPPASIPGPVVTTETLPQGWTATNVIASTGTVDTSVPGQIVWTVQADSFVMRTLNYMANPPVNACNDAIFHGVYDNGNLTAVLGTGLNVQGDDTLNQNPGPGDVWANASIAWQGATDLGSVNAPGYVDWFACDERYEIAGSGEDIWAIADECHFLYMYVIDDCEISAVVSWPTGPIFSAPVDYWSKAGIWLRGGLTPGAVNAGVMIRYAWGDREIRHQWRNVSGGDSYTAASNTFAPPDTVRLRLKREGAVVTVGYEEPGGDANLNWLSRQMPNIGRVAILGLGVTSHFDGALSVARFEDVQATATIYNPPMAQGTRSFASPTATMGAATTVTLVVPHLLDATSIAIVEQLPPNCIAQSASAGGVIGANTITWLMTPWTTTATVSYLLVPQWAGSYEPLEFSGSYAESGLGWREPIPDSVLSQTGTVAIFQHGLWPDPGYSGCTDAHILVFQSGYNTGAYDFVEEGDWGNGIDDHKKIMIRFDLSSLPTTTSVEVAILQMYYDYQRRTDISPTAHRTNIARLLKPWGEGFGNGYDGQPANFGDVTFQSAQAFIQDWEMPGAMGLTDASPPEGQSTVYGSTPGTWVTWDVTDAVQDFVTMPSLNSGWKISEDVAQGIPDNDPSNQYVQGGYNFISRNNASVSLRPKLILLGSRRYQGMIVSATRIFPGATYTWGRPTTVTLQVGAKAAGTSVSITETLPPGWVVDVVLDGGIEVSAGVLRWNVAPWTMAGATVRYVAHALNPWPNTPPPAEFLGGDVQDIAGFVLHIRDTVLSHEGLIVLQKGVLPDPTFTGCVDAHIMAGFPLNNTGGEEYLEEGHWGQPTDDHRKILIQFVLSNVSLADPQNEVLQAQLMLYYDRHRSAGNPDHVVRTQRILKNWNAGIGNQPGPGAIDGRIALTGEVTALSARHNQLMWERWGAMGATDAGPFGDPSTTFGSAPPGWVTLDVTQDVKDFLTSPSINRGWKISQDKVIGVDDNNPANTYVSDPGGAAFNFVSSDSPDAAHRPMLVIKTTACVPVEISRFMLY